MNAAPALPIVAREAWRAFPLPEAQQGLWYAQRLDPGNPAFNTGECLVLRGELDVAKFTGAVNATFDEADGLAVAVREGDAGPVIEYRSDRCARLEYVDLSDALDPAGMARSLMEAELAKSGDPERDAVVRTVLYRVGELEHIWFIRAHHVVCDGYGLRLITERVADRFTAAVRGTEPVGAAFPSYASVAVEAAALRGSERESRDREYWRGVMSGRVARSLSSGAPNPSYRHVEVPVDWGMAGGDVGGDVGGAAGALQALGGLAAAGAQWPDVLTTLFAAYVDRHLGDGEVVAGVVHMQRMGTAAARVPTMTMNVLPAPLQIDETATLALACRETAGVLREVRRHGRYRGEQIRRDMGLLGEDRRLHGPLINILPFGELPRFGDLVVSHEVLAAGPVDDLTLDVRGDAAGTSLKLVLQANPALYTEDAVRTHAARLGWFLARALRADRLGDVPTLTPDEEHQWVYNVNDTAHPVADGTLATLMAATVKRVPEATALVGDGHSLNWREFDVRTAALAAELVRCGVRPGRTVGVRMHRSPDLVLAIAAIVRAGGAWLPLSLDDPEERIGAIIKESDPALVITDETIGDLWLASEGTYDAERYEEKFIASPEDPAYVIYTSGSTGVPKGVVVTHKAIVNRLAWMAHALGVSERDRLLLKTPVTFDVSVWELWLGAVTGAALQVAPPDAHRDPLALATLIRGAGITAVHFVPSMLSVFLDEPSVAGLGIPRVIVSGEALSADLRDRFHQTLKGELINLYGPTEAAVDVTCWFATASDRSDPVPIGRPIWNCQTWVLDRAGRPVPPGVMGHLYLGGVQLAREYLSRPDLTRDAFVETSFTAPPRRMYRTGDLATWRSDGVLIFHGRTDGQVKLRGQRVELSAIETALRAVAGVRDAAVVMREDRVGDQRLVAYIVGEGELRVNSLRNEIAAHLPAHFIPSVFVPLGALPLTRHGKLDTRRLPAPEYSPEQVEHTGPPARTPAARLVADAYRRILRAGEGELPTLDDDFFALGGHSLLAVQLVRLLREAGYNNLTLGAVFAHPTVGALATRLEEAVGTAGSDTPQDGLGSVFRFASKRPDLPPLFVIHPAGGLAWCYRALAEELNGTRDVIGLQASGLTSGDALPASLTDLAEEYRSTIRSLQPSGALHLLGWSIGGVIAHEMTLQEERNGTPVATLAMLDAFPADRWRNAAEPDSVTALRAILLIAGLDPDAISVNERQTPEQVRRLLTEAGHPLAELSASAFEGILRTVLHNNRLVRAHRHAPIAGDLLYFRAARDHGSDGTSPAEWSQYVSGRQLTVDVDARHAEMPGRMASRVVADRLSVFWDERGLQESGDMGQVADTKQAAGMEQKQR